MIEASALSLGETIARLRKQKGWRQKELADRLSVHPRHVTRWETDRVLPRRSTLERLATTLDVPLETLLIHHLEETAAAGPAHEPIDRELRELLTQIHRLEPKEQEALKTFLQVMVKRVQLEELIRR